MSTQWLFWMAFLVPIANGMITLVLLLTGYNTRKVNTVIGIVALCLFVGSWIYVANTMASWTPAWFATATLFWIYWHRIQIALKNPGEPAVAESDFFIENTPIAIMGSYEMVDRSFDLVDYIALVSNPDGSNARLIKTISLIPPGKYLPRWENEHWTFHPVANSATH